MKTETKRVLSILGAAVLIAAAVFCVMFFMKQNKGSRQDQTSFRELAEQKDGILIDCLGDSITWGLFSSPQLEKRIAAGEIETGTSDGGQENLGFYVSGVFQSKPSYPEVLERELNAGLRAKGLDTKVRTVNDGLGGDWITERTYLRMTCDPDLVILLMGGNNYYFGYPVSGMFEANIKALRRREIPVCLVNYPLYPGQLHEKDFRRANEHIEKIAKKMNVPLFDVSSGFESLVFEGTGDKPEGMFLRSELFSPDRIHLSEKGYELLGTLVAEALLEEASGTGEN